MGNDDEASAATHIHTLNVIFMDAARGFSQAHYAFLDCV